MIARVNDLRALFDAHRDELWTHAYRMTASCADADDVVQETFARAIDERPSIEIGPLRPWLFRVATRLAIDALRARRRRAYAGPWLPTPIDTGDRASVEPSSPDVGARYDALESLTLAFLHALEALTPRQRAALVLLDVIDLSVRDAATALATTEGNVKVLHHRARKAMATYERDRSRPTAQVQEATRDALFAVMSAITARDANALAAALSPDVVTLNDGGGVFIAARRPVVGRAKVAQFWTRLHVVRAIARAELRTLNGLPAIVFEDASPVTGYAPRAVFVARTGADGSVVELSAIVAPSKIAHLFAPHDQR